ncbi:MAG: peroxiredoxin [Lautropia sp.]
MPRPRRRALAAAAVAAVVATGLWAEPAQAELQPGAKAPDFAIDATLGGKPFKFVLAEALQRGPVVLFFYPKAFSSGCTIEANAFAAASGDYTALGATVIGVSGDDIETLNRFSVSECRSAFAVGADRGGRVMKAYDAAMPYNENFAKRISYVISPQGRITYAFESRGPDQHVPNTLAALRALVGEPAARR